MMAPQGHHSRGWSQLGIATLPGSRATRVAGYSKDCLPGRVAATPAKAGQSQNTPSSSSWGECASVFHQCRLIPSHLNMEKCAEKLRGYLSPYPLLGAALSIKAKPSVLPWTAFCCTAPHSSSSCPSRLCHP